MLVPDYLRIFIFENLDSVEALEVLLLLFHDPTRVWTAMQIAEELRLNSSSVADRLRRLDAYGLAIARDNGFAYATSSARANGLVEELDEFYRTHRHRVLEAIFSPMRKAHDFARAFRVRAHRPKEDDND